MNQNAFKTRSGANKGKRLNLLTPDNKPSEAWVDVLGVDSDAFTAASRAASRDLIAWIEDRGDTKETRASAEFVTFTERSKLELRAKLVIAWSFEEPCTLDNVIAFLKEAPHVAQQIDEFASKRSQFVEA
jgi:hypothetical protein